MFGIGMPEMILILAIALIVIGPKKLPDLAKSLGRAMREFKKATNEFKETIQLDSEMADVKKAFNGIDEDVKEAVDPKTDQEDKSADGTNVDEEKSEVKKDEPESASDEFKNLKNLKNAFDDLNSSSNSTAPDQAPAVNEAPPVDEAQAVDEARAVDEAPADEESKKEKIEGSVDNARG
ncbi:MAG: twin-arginine translocase TatA/TatE family subunit [Desulfobacterales bacterium]|jgi:TatA/E family protein of Tat protein translocase